MYSGEEGYSSGLLWCTVTGTQVYVMDEGQLALLVQTLKGQIALTCERITQLQTVSNTLLKPDDTVPETEQLTPITPVRELEKRRLQLLMDVQKHDYIGEKLMVLISQNEELLAYLKLFLMEPRVDYSEESSNYVASKVNATADSLRSHIEDSRVDQARVALKLTELNDRMLELLDTTIEKCSAKET